MSASDSRRSALKHLGGLGAAATATAGLGGGLAAALGLAMQSAKAANPDYRVVICINLWGGADGNDILIPTDGAYLDYAKARPNLAIAKDSLIALNGSTAGHTFALPPAIKDLATLYNQGRLAMVANVGALVMPVTAAQVLSRRATVPPFLGSHAEQTAFVQGWTGDTDVTGWAGRSMELMPSDLKKTLPLISYDQNYTLLMGKKSRVTICSSFAGVVWGKVDVSSPTNIWTSNVLAMGGLQSSNFYAAEYARTLNANMEAAVLLAQIGSKAIKPANNFPSSPLGTDLRHLVSLLPVFKEQGARRQVFQVNVGSGAFDTHANQRGTDKNSLDTLLSQIGPELLAFDNAIKAAGLDQNVVTLVMSEFGRALQPAAGGGTDHGWGNHWMVMGGPVQGQQVLGSFPTLTLGGPDDGDTFKKGRWVPTISSDQVGATLMQWLGLASDQLTQAFPNLKNFAQKTVGFLRA